jgi:hypothetical protein
MTKRIIRDEAWLWSQVEKLPSGCWHWNGTQAGDGYGVVQELGNSEQAHRWAYPQNANVCIVPDPLDTYTALC